MSDDLLRLYAAWMLTHEMADEGMKASVARGRESGAAGMEAGPDAFVDGLMAAIAEEKERLVAELADRTSRSRTEGTSQADTVPIESVRFELGEIRGRLDMIERRLESLDRKLER